MYCMVCILFLQATAAVDVETDAVIQQTIRTEFAHATCLTVAHRYLLVECTVDCGFQVAQLAAFLTQSSHCLHNNRLQCLHMTRNFLPQTKHDHGQRHGAGDGRWNGSRVRYTRQPAGRRALHVPRPRHQLGELAVKIMWEHHTARWVQFYKERKVC